MNRSPAVAEIFISYRRGDSAPSARALATELTRTFGPQSVFLDFDWIEPGRAFAAEIERQLAGASVALIVIGSGWLEAEDDHGRRRLLDPNDLVRLEVESALRHMRRTPNDMLVVPVLVDNAVVPDPNRLPSSLHPLPTLQATPLRNADWNNDIDSLVAVVRSRLPAALVAPVPVRQPVGDRSQLQPARSSATRLISTLLSLALVGALLVGMGYGGYRLFGLIGGELFVATDIGLNPSSGPPGTEVVVTATGFQSGEEVRFKAFFSDQNAVVEANANGTAVWRVVLSGGFGPNTERITAQSEGLSDQADATFVYTS